jgi:Uma2 family endonuclease
MNLATTKLTYHDYLLLPDDGKRYEVIDGDLFVTPSPVTRHQTIAMRLSHIFMTYLETHPIGTILAAPCDVVLSEFNVVEPDLLFVHHHGTARITEKHIEGPPDLVIEILSPGTAARDRTLKRKRYEHFGVREYWLIDPDQNTLEILALEHGQFVQACLAIRPSTCTSALFPGLPLDLGQLLK